MQSELTDSNILISRLYTEDIEKLFEAVRASIKEVSVWLPWCHPDYSIQETTDWINLQMDAWDYANEYSFKIVNLNDGRIIGGVGLNQIIKEHRVANLGYWVRSGYTGKGIATSAALLCARFGFEELCLNRIEIIAAAENYASIKVAEKTGAKRDCILRNRLIVHNNVYDAVLYSLIPEDLGYKTL